MVMVTVLSRAQCVSAVTPVRTCGHSKRCDDRVTEWMSGDHRILFELPVTEVQKSHAVRLTCAPAPVLDVSGLGGL